MKEFLQNNEITYEDNPYVEKNEFINIIENEFN